MGVLLWGALFCGVLAGFLGIRKGQPVLAFLLGLFLGPLGILAVIFSTPKHRPATASALNATPIPMKRCAGCRKDFPAETLREHRSARWCPTCIAAGRHT